MIRYDCPHCGETLTVAPSRAGSVYVCGACGRETDVPGELPEPQVESLSRQIRRATRHWSSLAVIVLALVLLITKDIIVGLFEPPPPDAVVQPVPALAAARAALEELLPLYAARYTWRRASPESIAVRLTMRAPSSSAANELVERSLQAMTTACPGTTFMVEVYGEDGTWYGGSMRRGMGR